MSNILEQAKLFFDVCETGKGWDGCKAYCHPDATFSAQAGVLSEIDTLEGYSEWMKNMFTSAWAERHPVLPPGKYRQPGHHKGACQDRCLRTWPEMRPGM